VGKPYVTRKKRADKVNNIGFSLSVLFCFFILFFKVLIKGNEIKVKKGVELAQHLVEFYHAQVT